MADLVQVSDEDCRNKLRMDRSYFYRLCHLLQDVGGLKSSKYINVYEKVAMFLSILAHHSKNRCVKFQFKGSGQTVSKQFHSVLRSVFKLHYLLLVKPTPIPDDSNDTRWGNFKGCLGALDGTYIDVHIPSIDKGRYRNRKGNVLVVCDINMSFTYVLTGWEGSATYSRVLRDAIHREHGLKVPKGNYYLCDNGYPNCEGFLTLYKGVRYHLSEWNNRRPQNFQAIEPHAPGTGNDVFKGKASKGRRSWSRVEEDALISCLIDIVNDGWKADNSFKAGFQRELEKRMLKIFPGTDLVANPHINSKIHADPQVRGIHFKSWPFYSKWLDIFGKDRATGENAMDPIDLVNDLLRNDNQEQDGDNEDKYNSINPTRVNDEENNSVCMP
ncbi:hypothetical protein ACS0TY_005914 [Phlomoides rotata]